MGGLETVSCGKHVKLSAEITVVISISKGYIPPNFSDYGQTAANTLGLVLVNGGLYPLQNAAFPRKSNLTFG